jgi:hypothetical protein
MISESELKENENLLRKKIEDKSNDELILSNKLQKLYNSIVPLLNNLTKDPDKEYIYWPNRSTKVKEFIETLNDIMENDN